MEEYKVIIFLDALDRYLSRRESKAQSGDPHYGGTHFLESETEDLKQALMDLFEP